MLPRTVYRPPMRAHAQLPTKHPLNALLRTRTVAFWAEYKKMQAKSDALTYGWRRTELLGGLFNGLFLVSMTMFVTLQAVPRLTAPTDDRYVHLPVVCLSVCTIVCVCARAGRQRRGEGVYAWARKAPVRFVCVCVCVCVCTRLSLCP